MPLLVYLVKMPQGPSINVALICCNVQDHAVTGCAAGYLIKCICSQEHDSKIHVSVKQLRVVVTTRSADDPREHRTDVLAPLTLQLDAKLSSVIAGTIDLTTTKMVLACKTSTLDGLECIMHEHLCWLCLEQPARQPPPSMDSKLQV